MTSSRTTVWTIGVTLAVACAAVACSDDAADSLNSRHRGAGARAAAGGGGPNDPFDPNDPTDPNQLPIEEVKYRAVEPELVANCGRTCHDTGAYTPTPPVFLAGPDTYKSIKAQPGVIVRDVYASALLTKGAHAGPAVSADPEFERKIVEWLEAEAVTIQSVSSSSTPPFTVTLGSNKVDLTPASAGGLSGVRLEFEAEMVGSMLSLSKLTIVAPAGTDVHILRPRFVRVLAQPDEDGNTEVPDPADSFSNSDQTIPGGTGAPLAPGSVLFSAPSWRPFDIASDKLRIEVTKLEPGKVSVLAEVAPCKNVQGFTQNVLPTLRGTRTSANDTCQGCHGNGLGGLNLASQDTALICQQVLQKLNQANVAESLIVTKVTGGQHGGGQVNDTTAWRRLFVNNAGVFF